MNTASIEYNDGVPAQNNLSISEMISMFRRRFKVFAITSSVILTVAIVIAFVLPPVYKSTATILIQQQEIPEDLVRSTVTSFANQRIEMISQQVMTRSNLMEIIQKFNLYKEELERDPTEVVLDDMRDDINKEIISADVIDPVSGRPTQASIAFTVSFKNNSPDMAQKVANELTSLYLNGNLKNRTQMANEAEIFIAEEAERLRQQISELESQLAELKEHHMGSLPELSGLNTSMMDRTDQDILAVDQRIQAVHERKIFLESQLAQLSPNMAVYSDTGERILSPNDRLKTLESQLVSASAVYSDDHPDVVRMRKEIAALKTEVDEQSNTYSSDLAKQLGKERSELAGLQGRYAEDHPDIQRLKMKIAKLEESLANDVAPGVDGNPYSAKSEDKPDNPAYIKLLTELNAANAEISSLNTQKQSLDQKRGVYEQRLTEAPQVERQYRALTRDYENAQLKYREVKAKQMEAKMAKELETERKGERFTLIDPPQLPERPISPNRKVIAFFGLILSIGAGFGLIYLLENMDQSIRGSKKVVALLQTAPLAGIPYIELQVEKQKGTLKKVGLAATVVAGLIIALVLVHYFKTPLDVLWYVALRRFGIVT